MSSNSFRNSDPPFLGALRRDDDDALLRGRCDEPSEDTMGIRGAWSLLSNDPRRFGCQWMLKSDEKNNGEGIHVFVDAPSLLYHVAISDIYDLSPPLTPARIKQKSVIQQASPATIHIRVTNFIRSLLQVCQGAVHVVIDGLAPTSKIPTQIDRLRVMAIQGDRHATNPRSSCKLLHLMAETTMLETLRDLAESQPRLFLHQPLRGEAETYIDGCIRQHSLESHQVFILSDDTDFLVYPSCPGFIPFKTLEFHIIDGQLSLTGWHYQRAKFVSAFFSDCYDERILTTVASLAGCDYGMPECMSRARTKIIQSDIGGLRQRLRNDPTSAAALTAILRYVAHWGKRCKSLWLDSMLETLCPNGEARKQLFECLQAIHCVYFPNDDKETGDGQSDMSVDCRRLLECGILYCRPLVETWDKSSEKKQAPPARKRPRHKSGRKRRKEQPTDRCEMDVVDNPPRETAIPFPPSQSFVDHCTSSESMWSVLSQVRMRLYGNICRYAQQDNRLSLYPSWRSKEPLVTEYVRVGRGNNISFRPSHIALPNTAPTNGLSSGSLDAMLQCVVNEEQAKVLMEHVKQDWCIMIASLMLPPKSALLLILLSKPPRVLKPEHPPCAALSRSLRESLCLISIALLHASLLRNVFAAFGEDTCENDAWHGKELRRCNVFRNDMTTWIWAELSVVACEDEYEDSTVLLDLVFDQLKIPTKNEYHCNEQEFQSWHKDTAELWRIWCLVSLKATC